MLLKDTHSVKKKDKCGFISPKQQGHVQITSIKLESVTLICSGEIGQYCEDTTITVTLYKNNTILGQLFQKGKKIEYRYRIKSLQMSDSGIYYCVFQSNQHRLSTTIFVNISDRTETMDKFLPDDKEYIKEDQLYVGPNMKNVLLVRHVELGSTCLLECQFFSPKENVTINTFWIKHRDKMNYRVGTKLQPTLSVNISRRDACDKTGMVDKKCMYTSLQLFDIATNDHTFFTCVAEASNHRMWKAHLTFSVMVDATIKRGNKLNPNLPSMEFSSNSTVCAGTNFSFYCAADDSVFKMYLYKVHPSADLSQSVLYMNDSVLLKVRLPNATEVSVINDQDRHLLYNYFRTTYINHSLISVSANDTGRYLCVIEDIPEMPIKWKSMFLSVEYCNMFGINISTTTKYIYITICINLVFLLVACFFVILLCKHRNEKLKKFPVRKLIIVEYESPIYKSLFARINDSTSDSVQSVELPGSNPIISPIIRIKPLKRSLQYFERSCYNEQHPSTSTDKTQLESTRLSSPLDNEVFEYNSHECHNDAKYENKSSSSSFLYNSMYEFPHDHQWEFPREKLKITSRKLGEGAFGTVYEGLATDICDRCGVTKVGVKMMKDDFSDSNAFDFVKEIETMKQIGRHRHVIQLLGVCTQNGPLRVIVELAPYGNLRDYLRTKGSRFCKSAQYPSTLSRSMLCIYALQISRGMTYLSSRSIVHRDLSARNILVGENYDMKIADFGMTRIVDYYYRKKTDGILPVKWMAPEALLERKYTTKSDVWSYGILLWEIFSLGDSPYSSVSPENIVEIIKIGIQNPQPSMATKEIYQLMQNCWNLHRDNRPHFYQIVEIIRQILLKISDEPEQNIYQCEANYLEIGSGYLEPKTSDS